MRYNVGWFIPQQVMALTHFVPEVTPDDFTDIVHKTNQCLKEVAQPFYMLIDNRIIQSEQVVSLDVILNTLPQLRLSPLRWMIMILPQHIRQQAASMPSQRVGDIQLMYVANLAAAFDALQQVDDSLRWALQLPDFFAADTALNT
jgi:hypothetical protein